MPPRLAQKYCLENKLNPFGSTDVPKYLDLYRLWIGRDVEKWTRGDRDPFAIYGRRKSTEICDKFKLRNTFQWNVTYI
jgi:hypothetical protein